MRARFLRLPASRFGLAIRSTGRRDGRGRSQLAEVDLRARCKADAHLFHETAAVRRLYPYWIINLAGWLLGSAAASVGPLHATLHPGKVHVPSPLMRDRVSRVRDGIEIYDAPKSTKDPRRVVPRHSRFVEMHCEENTLNAFQSRV